MGRWMTAGIAVLLLSACASVAPPPVAVQPERGAAVPGFAFATDSFAFPNEIRARHPEQDDLYANYCFVLARGLRQFFLFARFEPAAPRLAHEGYVERVRAVAARAPWEPAPPADDRIVIPGYANLREFSRAEESAVKEGLGGRFWTWIHWTNWRVMLPVDGSHQEGVAHEILDDLRAGRLVQLLITNWPKPELNHTVVVFESRSTETGIEFVIWDPNDPSEPGLMTFERGPRRFWANHIYDTEPGP